MKKLKISFNLKSGFTTKIPVVATISFGYKEFDVKKQIDIYLPVRYYTGISVEPNEWDSNTNKPLQRKKMGELIQFEETTKEVYNYLLQIGEVTPKLLKDELDKKIKGRNSSKIINKIRIYDFIVEDIPKYNLSDKTKDNYRYFGNKILAFEKALGKPLYSNDFNQELYKQFMEHATENMNRSNAVWSVFKDLKSVLFKIGKKYKIPVFNISNEVEKKDLLKPNFPDSIYFTFSHIQALINFKSESEKLQNSKLILLTLIFTGCRESDVYKIFPDHEIKIGNEKLYYCRYFTQKTDSEIFVPILKPLYDAFKENKFNRPKRIPQRQLNEEIKVIAKLCGFKTETSLTYINAQGKKQLTTKKFYEFVSSHIGRRSFITNFINVIPLPVLTKITGHKMEDKNVIFGYNKSTPLENCIAFRKFALRAIEDDPQQFTLKLF